MIATNKPHWIEAIESSISLAEASTKVGVSRQRLSQWLIDNNLQAVRSGKLKVKRRK